MFYTPHTYTFPQAEEIGQTVSVAISNTAELGDSLSCVNFHNEH